MQKKVTIEHQCDEAELYRTLNASNAFTALEEMWQKVFRPAFKHGYPNEDIQKLIDACGQDEQGYSIGTELIDKLADLYREVLTDNNIDLERAFY